MPVVDEPNADEPNADEPNPDDELPNPELAPIPPANPPPPPGWPIELPNALFIEPEGLVDDWPPNAELNPPAAGFWEPIWLGDSPGVPLVGAPMEATLVGSNTNSHFL